MHPAARAAIERFRDAERERRLALQTLADPEHDEDWVWFRDLEPGERAEEEWDPSLYDSVYEARGDHRLMCWESLQDRLTGVRARY